MRISLPGRERVNMYADNELTKNPSPCSHCIHRCVCTYMDNYNEMIKALKKEFYAWPAEERAFMDFIDPNCKYEQTIGGVK